MAYKISKQGNVVANPMQTDFICDSADDINDLPTDVSWGATAFVIDGGRLFILNSKGEWKEV